ncbi:hypothetical protein H4219_003423 [Mycoemilia scoparia]|uniref:Uncharacterized protein n=1 Tax=Mycoemilia scoparia TaxID=417184 RepID=A0A9W8A0L9_9FUNG|nr:hypothetical protein H4219_003423 [Mycoemilia scoparia]
MSDTLATTTTTTTRDDLSPSLVWEYYAKLGPDEAREIHDFLTYYVSSSSQTNLSGASVNTDNGLSLVTMETQKKLFLKRYVIKKGTDLNTGQGPFILTPSELDINSVHALIEGIREFKANNGPIKDVELRGLAAFRLISLQNQFTNCVWHKKEGKGWC